jgi:hypothetical protein
MGERDKDHRWTWPRQGGKAAGKWGLLQVDPAGSARPWNSERQVQRSSTRSSRPKETTGESGVHITLSDRMHNGCLSVLFVIDIRRLLPRQPLRGASWGATTFYTSSVNAWCSLGPNGALSRPDGGAHGTMDKPNRPGQRAQDLQGHLTMSEGHKYPLVITIIVVSSWVVTKKSNILVTKSSQRSC